MGGGEKPLLERITFRQMEASAARAAFRNGEIDAVTANSLTAYNDIDGTSGAEPRRGQNLYAGGLVINPERLTDTALRRAIFATDYQDNYPTETGAEATKKIQPDANFSTVIGNKEYDVTFSGYGILGEDASGSAEYFYHSATYNGIGTDEIDAMCERLRTIESMEECNALSNEIEKKHMAEAATMIPIINGPEIWFCKTNLANYGAFLFARPYANPSAYINAGWVKE